MVPEKNKFTAKSRIKSFSYAFKGIAIAFNGGYNIKIQAICAIIAISFGFIFKINYLEWIIITLCIGIVFACETLNTAIEKIVDFISPDYNKKAGAIKDLAAGAVLITAIMSVVVAAIIFVPKIAALF